MQCVSEAWWKRQSADLMLHAPPNVVKRSSSGVVCTSNLLNLGSDGLQMALCCVPGAVPRRWPSRISSDACLEPLKAVSLPTW